MKEKGYSKEDDNRKLTSLLRKRKWSFFSFGESFDLGVKFLNLN